MEIAAESTLMDNELFRTLMEKHAVLLKQIAGESGLSTSAIDRFRHDNGRTPPLVAWRSLMKLTGDMEPAHLMLNGTGWSLVNLERINGATVAKGLAAVIEAHRKHIRAIENYLAVLLPGPSEADHDLAVDRARASLNECVASVLALRERLGTEPARSVTTPPIRTKTEVGRPPLADHFIVSRLTRPGDLVKAKIIALGVRLGDLAESAGIAKPHLTRLLQGMSRNRSQQYRVFKTLRELSGVRSIQMDWLWGELLAGKGGEEATGKRIIDDVPPDGEEAAKATASPSGPSEGERR